MISITLITTMVPMDVYGTSGDNHWPTWRGPDGTGAAKNGNPPINWSETENIKWKVEVPGESVSSPLLYGDKLYFCSVNKAEISCYQAETGKAHFVQQELDGLGDIYSSPVGAADRVYFFSRNGAAKVIRHSDKFEVLATNKLDDEFSASPAIVADELYLKGKEHFYCIARQ